MLISDSNHQQPAHRPWMVEMNINFLRPTPGRESNQHHGRGSSFAWCSSFLCSLLGSLLLMTGLMHGFSTYAIAAETVMGPAPANQKKLGQQETPSMRSPDETVSVQATTSQSVESRQKEAEESKRLLDLFLRNQNVFIRKGEFMLELNSFYNRNSRTTLQPIAGGVAIAQETRRFFDTTVIGRYGLLIDGLEVDVIVPAFIHAEQTSDFGVLRGTQEEDGVGDIGAALRYQVWYERGARPALVLDITGKSRTGGTGLTGSGTWNAGGGVTLLKSFDPVVFFGRLGYVYNFASETRDLGNIIDYRVGMGFSLNDRVSLNIQFTGAYIGPSKVLGTGLAPGGAGFGPVVFSSRHVEIMNLVFTTTVIVTRNFFVEPLIGVGLTNESFTVVGLRLPYRF